jgi:quinol monooxygenase YgiN
MQLRQLAVFAEWESESALEAYLASNHFGQSLSKGWYLRLRFQRRWGQFSGFGTHQETYEPEMDAPVVAVTIARLKLSQTLRFIRWGKPVEELVRDHPGTTLALAAMRPPRTFSTFSVWRSLREMTEMVQGHGTTPDANRHAKAMMERKRKDFHHEFTTFRFQTISEHGEWIGRSNIAPTI